MNRPRTTTFEFSELEFTVSYCARRDGSIEDVTVFGVDDPSDELWKAAQDACQRDVDGHEHYLRSGW